MLVRDVHIHPVTEGKGRTFSSAILGVATANPLWDGGSKGGNDTTRPVLVVFAGSDQEIQRQTTLVEVSRLESAFFCPSLLLRRHLNPPTPI
jgi:hypothetical protein